MVLNLLDIKNSKHRKGIWIKLVQLWIREVIFITQNYEMISTEFKGGFTIKNREKSIRKMRKCIRSWPIFWIKRGGFLPSSLDPGANSAQNHWILSHGDKVFWNWIKIIPNCRRESVTHNVMLKKWSNIVNFLFSTEKLLK